MWSWESHYWLIWFRSLTPSSPLSSLCLAVSEAEESGLWFLGSIPSFELPVKVYVSIIWVRMILRAHRTLDSPCLSLKACLFLSQCWLKALRMIITIKNCLVTSILGTKTWSNQNGLSVCHLETWLHVSSGNGNNVQKCITPAALLVSCLGVKNKSKLGKEKYIMQTEDLRFRVHLSYNISPW